VPRSGYVLLDTGPVVALVNRADRYHASAFEWFRDFRSRLLTTEAVITEVAYVLSASAAHQTAALAWFDRVIRAGLLRVEPLSDLPAIAAVIERYPTRRPDFADASLVWLASVHRIDRIATLDDIDFRVYRSYANKAFVNVFPLS
jgi:predicted nucleic acid-binding protein